MPLVEKNGAQVRPLHIVDCVSRENGEYLVHFKRIENGSLFPPNGPQSISSSCIAILLRSRQNVAPSNIDIDLIMRF